MTFQPKVDQELTIEGKTYRIVEHPAARGMPYGQEGRAATVYQLKAGEERRAIKVFKPRFRVPAMVALTDRLETFASLPGLRVCHRTVLTPRRHTELLREHPDLLYAVLMPWIEGPTWMEVMLGEEEFSPERSLHLARTMAEILAGMEERGVAHCDLSGPNVLLPALAATQNSQTGIELVDVEQLYGPGLDQPAILTGGSSGYDHQIAPEGFWSPYTDRFAGALLLAEMLGWCDDRTREATWGETFFDPKEMQKESERSHLMSMVLRERWGQGAAHMFEQAWHSERLADCPSFGEWLLKLPSHVPTASIVPTSARTAPMSESVTAGLVTLPIATANPTTVGDGDQVRDLLSLAQQAEERGDIASALNTYREAQTLAGAGSGLAHELELIIGALSAKQSARQAVTAADAAPSPSAPTPQQTTAAAAQVEDAALARLFDDAVAAHSGREWAAARELLTEVVRRQPNYSRGGQTASELLAEAEQNLTASANTQKLATETTPSVPASPVELRAVEAAPKPVPEPAPKPAPAPPAAPMAEVTEAEVVPTWVGTEGAETDGEQAPTPHEQRPKRSLARVIVPAAVVALLLIFGGIVALYITQLGPEAQERRASNQAAAAASATVEANRAEFLVRTLENTPGHSVFALSPDGQIVASIGYHSAKALNAIWLHDLSSGATIRDAAQQIRVMEGHQEDVQDIDFSPDGQIIATGSKDKTVRLWQKSDGTLLHTLKEHTNWVNSVAFSPDGKTLVSGSADGTVLLWNVSDGARLRTLKGKTDFVYKVAFSPDGRTVAAGVKVDESDSIVLLWNASDGALLRELGAHRRWTHDLAFSPDGQTLLVIGSDGDHARTYRVSDGARLQILDPDTEGYLSRAHATFSPDGQLIAVFPDYAGEIRLFRTSNGERLPTYKTYFRNDYDQSSHLAFSPDGKLLAALGESGIDLWRVPAELVGAPPPTATSIAESTATTATSIAESTATTGPPGEDTSATQTIEALPADCCAFPPGMEETAVAQTTRAASIALQFTATAVARAEQAKTRAEHFEPISKLSGHEDKIETLAISPDGQTVASAGKDMTIRLWRIQDGSLLRVLKGHADTVNSVAFSPDGKLLASGSDDKTVRTWKVEDGTLLHTLEDHEATVLDVAFSPDGKFIAAADVAVKLWRVADGKLLRTLRGTAGRTTSVAMSFPETNPSLVKVLVGTSDGTMELWWPELGKLERSWEAYVDKTNATISPVDSLASSPDSNILASGSFNGVVRLWNESTGELLRSLEAGGIVFSVAFSPDGEVLAVATSGGEIQLWQVSNGSLIRSLKGHTDWVTAAVFAPDGQTIATGSYDKTIWLWQPR